ncbi:MAG: FtsK/SpoIIIE domain-containing protein [Pseudonocardiales bacterium]
MHLRLSVDGTDLDIDAPAGAPLSSVLPQLRALTGGVGAAHAGGELVPDHAPLGAPPLTCGAVLTLGSPGIGSPVPATGLMQLHVVGGPDAGGLHVLPHGSVTVGRGPAAELRIADPDLSREHATLDVTTCGANVRDCGSTNGTFVDTRQVGAQPLPLPPGALLRAGESTFCVAGADDRPIPLQADGQGQLAVNRPPRLLPRPAEVVVRMPVAPESRGNPKFPLLAMLIPLAIGAVMVPVMGSWTFAIFMLLSPVMLGANALSDKIGGRRAHRAVRADYLRDRRTAVSLLTAGLAAEADLRRRETPDAAALLRTALGPGRRLWERRPDDPDALSLRLGTSDLPAQLTVRTGPVGTASGDEHTRPVVVAVPVTLPLREVGVLGLAGPRPAVAGLARHAVAHLAALHSPRDLELVILCSPADRAAGDWRWARWLPHLLPGGGQACRLLIGLTEEQIAVRVTELVATLEVRRATAGRAGSAPWTGAYTVLLLDGARQLRAVPGVAQLLADGPRVGIHAICLAGDPLALPSECGATAVVTGAVGTRLVVSRAGHPPVAGVVADLVSIQWAERFARALAALRDGTPDGSQAALPASARLLDLLGADPPTPTGVAAGWQAGGGSTAALLGAAADGPFLIDLRRDGPHALVAGTTGSGKSELLQTLVASLALNNRPDQLAFVLVDYKGGSAFADCARLPHTVGLVTDLDGHLTRRALASLDAELKRRERLLRAAGRKDLDDYLAGSPAAGDGDPLPRLVIVIDEFASLAHELPDFVTGLVDIARRGRSLGVHLVLATQRPAGVVSGEIRANTNLRIALRVTDPAESQDVIDSTSAALIGQATPGRACCRSGSGGVVAFQCARVGGRGPGGAAAAARVSPLRWEKAGDPPPAAPVEEAQAGPTDLARLVEAVRAAARSLGAPALRSPWLPPLPELLVRADLPRTGSEALSVGLLDLPTEQAQRTFSVDLAHGEHLLAAGGPGSGRTTLLRTLAGAIGADTDLEDVHLYALDCAGGGLLAVQALPHCGAAVARTDVDRGDRLLGRLAGEVARRQQVLGRDGYASLAEQRAAVAVADRLPWLVLLLDGWEGFVAGYEGIDAGRPVETMFGLLREGSAAGLRVVVAGDRSLLTGRVSSLIPGRLVLRMADPLDYSLAGLAPRQVPQALRPGRGVIPGPDAVEVQVALLSADPAGRAQVAELARLADVATRRATAVGPRHRPFRLEALPERVSYPQLVAAQAPRERSPLWTAIGLGGDDLSTVGVDLADAGPAFLVAGPPRSGRSTALVTMARWSIEQGAAVLTVTPRRSPLRDLAGVLGNYSLGQEAQLAERLHTVTGAMVVFADDAGELLDTEMDGVLAEVLRTAGERPWALVVAAVTEELITTYRGITVEARRHRSGLLISPSGPIDGEVLGLRLPRGPVPRAGRAVLAVRGCTTPLQVAC